MVHDIITTPHENRSIAKVLDPMRKSKFSLHQELKRGRISVFFRLHHGSLFVNEFQNFDATQKWSPIYAVKSRSGCPSVPV
jgi:hypothetical protein